MPYTPTTWVEGVTSLGPTNMNHIEGGLQTADANATTGVNNAATAQTTANNAVPKSVVTVAGDIIYATGSAAVTRLGIGAAGTVLHGGASAPSWSTLLLSEISGYPSDGTKFAAGDGTWKSAGATIFRSAGSLDVNTTLTETDVLSQSIAGNSMGANGHLRVRLIGDYLNNIASSLTFKVKFGGTTFWGDATTQANSATRRGVIMDFTLANVNATNVNFVSGAISLGDATAGSVAGIGHVATVLSLASAGTQAIDTTSAQTLAVSITHGVSSASASFRRFAWMVEVL